MWVSCDFVCLLPLSGSSSVEFQSLYCLSRKRDPYLAPPPTNLLLITRLYSSFLLITYQIHPALSQSEVMYFYVVLALLPLFTAALTPNEKLKKCCATLKHSDKECVEKFCDLSAISQANVSLFSCYFRKIEHS